MAARSTTRCAAPYGFVVVCLLAACGLVPSGRQARPEPPLNVLVLYADDWRHDTLGCAGNPVVETPILDDLAERGVRFTRNSVTTSICGVSRATLYTGQWMSRHGATGFTMWDTPWEETYPGLLRANGYHVGHVGKWHNRPFPRGEYDFSTVYHGRHWYPDEDSPSGRIHVTERNERDALRFLAERPRDRPFALTVCFFATHAEDGHEDQFLPQPTSMELSADIDVPVPVNATQESWENLPEFFDEQNEGRNRWHWRFDTPEKYQRMMKNYYRMANEVDAACGAILLELEEQGVLDETLVIFTTDNGYYHGEHGLADKWYPHEESIRVPLIIWDPRLHRELRGSTDDCFTLSVDLAPTILAAAGIEAPPRMQGRDIAHRYLPIEDAESARPWRTEFFYEHPTLRDADFIPASEALVRRDWKYMVWPEDGVEQLFDLAADPIEENDLAGDPAYAAVLDEMRAAFAKRKAEAQ